MTTESPVRFLGGASSKNLSCANELELLLKGQKIHGNRRDATPSRSGSAPPSMEGSLYALANFDKPDESSLDGRLSNINSFELQESEDQLRADPAYIDYYLSNVNLNPRLPPPLISRENRHLAWQIGHWGVNQALHSFDDSNKGYLTSGQAPLSTYEEEVEEDCSPTADTGAGYLSEWQLSSKEGQYKSRVDVIQEDNPRAPSPIYSNQSPLSSFGLREEAIHSDAHVNPQQDLSEIKTKSLKLGIYAGNSTKLVRSVEQIRNNDLSASSLPNTSSHESEKIFYRHIEPKRDLNMEKDKLSTDGAGSIVSKITTGTRNISILNEQKNYHPRQNLQHISSHSRGSAAQCHASSSNITPQSLETQYLRNDIDQFSYRQSKLPLPIDINPGLQMTGYSMPLYGWAANYMNLENFFNSNVQQSSLFAPQYNVSGYAVNASIVPSLFTGYASPGATVTLENPVNVTGGNAPPGVDWQQLYKYGHLGVPVRPSVLDPLYFPYLQQPFFNAFGAASQYDPLMHNYDLQKGPMEASTSHQMLHQKNSVNIHNQMKGAISSPIYYGTPQKLGTPLQCPSSSFTSSTIQKSPVVGTTISVMRNEGIRLPVASYRNDESYPGWQGQRRHEKIDDPKMYSFLDELKSSKTRRFELSDIVGHIVEFSTDQHGSRFIQQKLEHCNDAEKKHVFEEVLPHASTLMTDVFGNYVIQKFFEHGNSEQRKELANKLVGRVLSLSLQMYGCRVVQKALEVVENDQKTQLVKELDGNIMRCVRDQNGNHVIQKCIECMPTKRIEFIISSFQGQVATLSTHPYGCRVIQRVLEHCTDELQSQSIIDEVLQSACFLAQDQYGNYVTQHVLERGRPQERNQIISKLAGQIVHMSQNKFASNVIEKCLEHGDSVERELLIEEMVGQTEGNESLLVMMKDQYANYVIQKILDICDAKQQEILINRIKVHLPALKKYTYGKHIVARVEKLSSEGSHAFSD